ncbi:M48 family metallopeptidase [Actinosynnema sp. NPDC020468]|uniref:M48 family metallopeptidase n=1 Tax=Actinosynnema sp. NPDC020468 TaxID=3154488 RepID=UPI0033DE63C3
MAFHPSDFEHPLDRSARQNLESIPLLRPAVEKYLKHFDERAVRNWQMSDMLRLGPRQYPRIYRLLPPICEAYGIEEPELYLMAGPVNAMTMGHARPSITLYSGLVESMQDDEIQAVLAHECGHIVGEHVLLLQMARVINTASGYNLFTKVLSFPLHRALMAWMRMSELSADRAAAAFMGSGEEMTRTMLRIVGIPSYALPSDYSLELFAEQAVEAETLRESRWDRLLEQHYLPQSTHPLVSARVLELKKWVDTEAFRRLSAIALSARTASRCETCGHHVEASWKFCHKCGRRLGAEELGAVRA